ncbi:unnamed protein product [Polarella glacialis]|uniref:Uncharacterized protein n=1 Tax=Polarella glacialis TaxID=89957 RepID=A0A813CZU7_POLGL|nr:unnamed protein product [Polarella glacialis]
MDNSLAQMLEVGSYFVWFAMVLFSLVWPYVKLLLMLHVWIAPVSTKTRGPLLMFLDQVGKWSLTDNFILFLFVVLFWISWTGSDVVEGGSASFRLKCSPSVEMNTFLGGTILSLLLGHAVLWTHRWESGTLSTPEGSPARPGRARLITTALGLVSCIGLVIASFQAEIVEVYFGGVIGTFLKVTGQPNTQRYSILGIYTNLGTQGSAYLQASFCNCLFLFVSTILCCFLLLL